jgi:CNT family concentrative nucleoside transporter
MEINQNVQIILGFIGLIALAIPFSSSIKKINYIQTLKAVIFQIILAYLLIEIEIITNLFSYLSKVVLILQESTNAGTQFVFGYLSAGDGEELIFAFKILPLIIVFSSLTAFFWYVGLLPFLIRLVSKLFERVFNIGGPIGLGSTANIIMGQVEAPLLVRPYLKKMSKKEILILMTSGMATVAGSVMIAYVTMLQNQFPETNLIQHMITASVLSIPAAIMYSNIMIPEDDITEFNQQRIPRIYSSPMDAIIRGTRDGTDIAINVAAVLISFIAIVYLVDSFLGNFSINNNEVSLQLILGYFFYPIVWLMGIPSSEVIYVAELLGIKTALNEFVAYAALAEMDSGLISDRSKLIAMYALCGFANLSSVGILISGISAMCPEIKDTLISVAFRSLVAATLASCMTGLVIGIFS